MSLPRYPEYKDSGVEWLGEVPAHWEARRLKTLSPAITVGIVVNPSDYISDAGLPFIYGGDIAEGHISTESCRRITPLDSAKQPKTRLKSRDLLTVRVGAPGVTAVVSDECEGGNCASVMLIRRGGFDSDWLCYAMNSRMVRCQVEVVQYGAAQEQFNIGHAINFWVATPSVEEQFAIATFLDRETGKIDALIAEQENLLTLLAEKRQATISHAVTRGLNPNAPMKDSGVLWLGEVPVHWRVTPLKYLVSLRSGGTPSKERLEYWDGQVPWASARDLKSETLADTTEHLTDLAMESGAATLLPAGAVLVVVRGMILARMFPVTETRVPTAINQDLKAVLPKPGLAASFLAWLLRGTADESLQRLDEAGHGTKALRMDAWTSMQLPIPPVAEQDEIVQFIAKRNAEFDSLAGAARQAVELLKERRSALIAAAVTGKIDVRQAA